MARTPFPSLADGLQPRLLLWAASAVLASGYDNGAAHSRMPPLGWSSWVALGKGWDTESPQHPYVDFCDEVSVKASIDAFFEVGLYKAGYRHFRLDDCWADKHRNGSGYLQADRVNFPNGMQPLIDYAHSRGLSFGLYTCAGPRTCAHGRMGSKGHFAQDAKVFAEWKVDSVKMDWCWTSGMDPKETFTEFSQALNATGHPIHLNMCEWGYNEPFEWGPAVAQSWRATGDHHGSWSSTLHEVEVRSLRVPAELGGMPYAWNDLDMLQTGNYHQAGRPDDVFRSMTATEYRTEFSMWAIFASPLIVTTPLLNCSSTDAARGHFTPTRCRPALTDLQKEILLNTEVIAINQDVTQGGRRVWPPPLLAAESTASAGKGGNCSVFYKDSNEHCNLNQGFGCDPQTNTMWIAKKCRGAFTCNGIQEVLCPPPHANKSYGSNLTCDCVSHAPPPGVQVFVRNLSGGDAAIALYNPDNTAASIHLNFNMAGFKSGTSVKVRDLWKHADEGIFKDHLPLTTVQPHETILLRATPQGSFVAEQLLV